MMLGLSWVAVWTFLKLLFGHRYSVFMVKCNLCSGNTKSSSMYDISEKIKWCFGPNKWLLGTVQPPEVPLRQELPPAFPAGENREDRVGVHFCCICLEVIDQKHLLFRTAQTQRLLSPWKFCSTFSQPVPRKVGIWNAGKCSLRAPGVIWNGGERAFEVLRQVLMIWGN